MSESGQPDRECAEASVNIPEDEDLGMTDEIRTWARGCLFVCVVCDSDFAGLGPFESHLASLHNQSLQTYKRKHGASQACVLSGFHFCKMCSNNVRHDEVGMLYNFISPVTILTCKLQCLYVVG